jgi:hypothetical protein
MTQPDPADTNAVGGAHPGTKSRQEMAGNVSFDIDPTRSLGEVSSRILRAAEFHTNALADTNTSPKYAVDPNVSYYGAGALSIVPRLGKLLMSSSLNEANRGAFTLDQSDSSFYSSMDKTTLGSLKIDTVDGYELNPVSPVFPSTNFSPTKPWIKKLFPTLSSSNLVRIALLELVGLALLRLADKKPSENFESKPDIDMATIIVDNQKRST